jgi:hypothetical protein
MGNLGFQRSLHPPGDTIEQEAARLANQVDVPASLVGSLSHLSGEPMSEAIRSFWESRLGLELGDVRLHHDAAAAQAAAALSARAFTIGRDVVFGDREFDPATSAGARLLGHELVHVGQQARGTRGIQREPGPEAPAPGAPTSIDFTLGPIQLNLTTHNELAALVRLLVGQVDSDLEGLPESSPARERASDWQAWIRWYLPYLDRHGAEPLTPEIAAIAKDRIAQCEHIRQDITTEKQLPVLERLRQARIEAAAAAAAIEALQPKLDDGLRAAYRTGKESAIKEAVHVIGTSLELGVAMHELSREIAEGLSEWKELSLPEVGRFTEGLHLLAKGLAVLSLAFALTEEERPTELEEGMRFVGLSSEAFGAGLSVAAAPAHMVLYANVYLVPLTQVIIAQIGRLVEALHGENVAWVQVTGELGRPEVEPGGDKMFKFMKKVMNADREEEVPALVDPDIKKYLLEHREQLAVGTGEEMPITGWWWWRDIETGKARKWFFANRQTIWAMFYGRMPVNERGT